MKKLECIQYTWRKNRPLMTPSFRKCSERKIIQSYLFCNDFNKEKVYSHLYIYLFTCFISFSFNFWLHPMAILTITIPNMNTNNSSNNNYSWNWYLYKFMHDKMMWKPGPDINYQEFGKFLYFILKFYLSQFFDPFHHLHSITVFIKIIVKAS